MRRAIGIAALVLVTGAASTPAQPSSPVRFLDVPYIQQSEALCGGAAAAMVMRYWGATGVYAETFAPLVDREAGGIRAEDLLQALRTRGWDARSFRGDATLVQSRLAARQPLIALIEDRPGAFHFVVVVAWTNGRVVYHDPARAPFRVVDEARFDAAWQKSNRWTMLALPAPDPPGTERPADLPAVTPSGSPAGAESPGTCAALVAQGVRTAEAGQRAEALDVFAAAADLCPTASAPLREAAGVHALNGDWRAAAGHARAALARDDDDELAWRILATSAYLDGKRAAALEAWNAIAEPTVDLVTVRGLNRTRYATVTALVQLKPGDLLTAQVLTAAGHRVHELPSADVARVSYTPVAGGRANLEVVVLERPRWPLSRGSLVGIGLHLLTDRELSVKMASLTGGGELVHASWRWWEQRPRLAVAYAVPSAAGVWRVNAFGEKQTYGRPDASLVESRRGGSLSLANWTDALLRWEIGAGIESWADRGRTAHLHGTLEQRLAREHVSVLGHGNLLGGSFSAWTAGLGVEARTARRHEGLVLAGRAGLDATSASAPFALWHGAGTGHGRGPLLRAHPLLDDGRIAGEVFGRRLYHGGIETRHWLRPVFKVLRIAPAVFVDAARAERTRRATDVWHVDAGIGLRAAVGGGSVLRLDVAKGLRDGDTAISLAWTR